MFTQFLTLMDHFFIHYSTQPCWDTCPCRERVESAPAPTGSPPVPAAVRDPESKDEKKEVQEVEFVAEIDPFEVDKAQSDKCYFHLGTGSDKHRKAMLLMVAVFTDITRHMGAILHGLHTCIAEQFARERYGNHPVTAHICRAVHGVGALCKAHTHRHDRDFCCAV